MSDKQSRWGRRRVVAGMVAAGLAAAALSVVAPGGVAQAATVTYKTVLTKGQTVAAGHVLTTGTIPGANPALNHSYELVLQANGNLVEYSNYPAQGSRSVFWRSDTAALGKGGHLSLTSAGDLVATDAHGTWKSGTVGNAVTHLAIGTNGDMLLLTAHNKHMWSSRTGLCAKEPITNGKISTLISSACRQVAARTWYSWDAGHAAVPGPTPGVQDTSTPELAEWTKNDPSRTGFDCSGLTRWAYYRATGHDIPGGANASRAVDEWNAGMTGTKHQTTSTAGVRLGDFLFFKTGTDLHHTAIYIGKSGGVPYLVEAPQSNSRIQVARVDSHRDFYGYIHVWHNF